MIVKNVSIFYIFLVQIDYGLVKTLKSRIRISAVNFVKETLVGLPAVPTEEELEKLKANRKKEAEKKIAEEKLKAQEAKIKFEQQQMQQQVRNQIWSFDSFRHSTFCIVTQRCQKVLNFPLECMIDNTYTIVACQNC